MSRRKHAWDAYPNSNHPNPRRAVEAAVIQDFMGSVWEGIETLETALEGTEALVGVRLAMRELMRVSDQWTE